MSTLISPHDQKLLNYAVSPKGLTSLTASICKESFEFFVKEFWNEVPMSQPLVWNWHMSVICEEMEYSAKRVAKSLPCEHDTVFNVPFGTSKSSLCSILFNAWVWTFFPQARFITGTHTEPLGVDLSSKSLAVIESERYRDYFPHVVLIKTGENHFTNTSGGERRVCTVGGKAPLGMHGHFLGIDDPIDPQGAKSQAELENAGYFMDVVIPSRKVKPKWVPWTYLVMQRLCKGDPSDVMVEAAEKEGAIPVKRFVLPGELGENVHVHPPELAGKYVDGLLDANLLPRKVLNNYRSKGAFFYAAQVLQNPMALGGGMFKIDFFNNRVRAAPYHCKRIRYWDRASSIDSSAANTAGVLMAKDDQGNFYVENVVVGKWEPDERNRVIRATALRDKVKYGPKYDPVIWIEREGGSSGRDAWKSIMRALAGFRVREDTVTGSKDTRAEPWACQCASGTVYIVDNGEKDGTGKADWDINAYVLEHCLFRPEPGKRLGRMKDMVDSSSGGFNLLTGRTDRTGFQVLNRLEKNKGLRIVIANKEELANLIIEDQFCLLITLSDPSEEGPILPLHGITKLTGTLQLNFCDLDPKDYQDKWDDLIAPWDAPVRDLIINQETGKKLWSFLLRKRDSVSQIWVLQDDGDRRAMSIGMSICQTLGLDKKITLYVIADPDNKSEGIVNQHIVDMVRTCRGLVIG